MLIAEESKRIENECLRLRVLPQQAQSEVQDLFRRYAETRLETYRRLPNMEAAEREMANSRSLQEEIWTRAIDASALPNSHPDARKLLLPALNSMIDITTTRTMALQPLPPNIIYGLLFSLGLICSLLAGYRISTGQHRSWLHILSFTVITVIIVYVITDVEYPRAGLIRLQGFDQLLVEVRDNMK